MFESAVTTLAEGIVLINLTRLRGTEAVCSRVPAEPGVYAWFKGYQPPPPETSTGKEFATYLGEQATRGTLPAATRTHRAPL